MKYTTLCLILVFFSSVIISGCGSAQGASLRVSPNRLQFYEYDPVSLSCEEQQGNFTGWTVKRSTTSEKRSGCGAKWGKSTESCCVLSVVLPWDSGVYWCESGEGESSDALNITVSHPYYGAVILESPAHPVTEGNNVTLRCLVQDLKSFKELFNFSADFYKDGSLIRSESAGEMTIPVVSKSDEGLYKCKHKDKGAESPQSWLAVRASATEPSPAPLMSLSRLVCHLVVFCPYLLSTILLVSIYTHKPGGTDPLDAEQGLGPISTGPVKSDADLLDADQGLG